VRLDDRPAAGVAKPVGRRARALRAGCLFGGGMLIYAKY